MPELLISAVAFLLAIVFAAVWGAHLFETGVLYAAWTTDPPKSFIAFLESDTAKPLAGFWRTLVPGLYTMAFLAIIVAAVAGVQTHLALAVAGVCGLIHLAMIVLIFSPTNVKLGFYGGPGAASLDPQVARGLIFWWGKWNYVRLGFETAGLIAAIIAFRMS
jgi:hypothetical protein